MLQRDRPGDAAVIQGDEGGDGVSVEGLQIGGCERGSEQRLQAPASLALRAKMALCGRWPAHLAQLFGELAEVLMGDV